MFVLAASSATRGVAGDAGVAFAMMAVTNGISSVIIVNALIAAGPRLRFSQIMGFVGVALASVNIFGGFLVTYRMLSMFKKKGR
jgi:NAD(P) transhydrogenase subunit alpha